MASLKGTTRPAWVLAHAMSASNGCGEGSKQYIFAFGKKAEICLANCPVFAPTSITVLNGRPFNPSNVLVGLFFSLVISRPIRLKPALTRRLATAVVDVIFGLFSNLSIYPRCIDYIAQRDGPPFVQGRA